MKTSQALFAVLILSCFMSCQKKDNPVNATNTNARGSSGQVLLKVSASSVPPGVTTITATLTRTGFDTLTAALDVTDTTGIIFNNVLVGTWHLNVDARNNSNIVLYTGQTDVVVADNTVTQVNITLNPVSTGVGGVHIIVTWGSQPSGWVDFANNPIFHKSQTDTISNGVYAPKILIQNGVYKMWFTYYQSKNTSQCIGYATSQDGIHHNP
jgi:hypothetical protein